MSAILYVLLNRVNVIGLGLILVFLRPARGTSHVGASRAKNIFVALGRSADVRMSIVSGTAGGNKMIPIIVSACLLTLILGSFAILIIAAIQERPIKRKNR
jgi:hypothetical protein